MLHETTNQRLINNFAEIFIPHIMKLFRVSFTKYMCIFRYQSKSYYFYIIDQKHPIHFNTLQLKKVCNHSPKQLLTIL